MSKLKNNKEFFEQERLGLKDGDVVWLGGLRAKAKSENDFWDLGREMSRLIFKREEVEGLVRRVQFRLRKRVKKSEREGPDTVDTIRFGE